MNKLKIGISSCLLGNKVRYDGNHKLDRYITETLGRFFDWVPVCPEAECGLGIPRESMHLVQSPGIPRLVTTKTHIDHTVLLTNWTKDNLEHLLAADLCGFIFKAKSPSCALLDARHYTEDTVFVKKGPGLFSSAFSSRFPLTPAIDDGRLHNQELRENFIERVFVYARWQSYLADDPNCANLVRFHQKHKLLIMSHSPQKQHDLGKLVAGCGKEFSSSLQEEYIKRLMEALSLPATVKKQTNVLQHISGYFKKQLTSDQKLELQEVIENYHRGLIPLIVPITLLKHYMRLFDEPYLKEQIYLDPHPLELMLRNHV